MKKSDNWLFYLFGTYLVLIGILAFINAFLHLDSAIPLWFCYIAVFLIGIGILTKNSDLIVIQLNLILISLIFWNIDFFYQLITGNSLWGITDYFFVIGWMNSLGNFLTLQHIYTIPVAVGFVYLLGIRRRDLWKFSFLEAAVLFFIGFFFSPKSMNANCVFDSCVNFISLKAPYYQFLWFLAVFLMIFLSNKALIYLMGKVNRA